MKTIYIGLAGFGTVGSGVYQILQENQALIARRLQAATGAAYEIKVKKILVREPQKYSSQVQPLMTTKAEDLLEDEEIHILCELMGGDTEATSLMEQALLRGKHVVTANKKALFKDKGRLTRLAANRQLRLKYEAAVAGVIPIIRVLEESLASEDIFELQGILNGSTNYILTKISEGLSYEKAIEIADAKGFLEADPTSDLEGFDAMYKLGILAGLLTGEFPEESAILRTGISAITLEEIEQADQEEQKIKLVARLKKSVDGQQPEPLLSVKPEALGKDHPLYQLDGALNGILLRGENCGELFFSGAGAGSRETATAVLGDIISIIRSECHE